MGGSIKPDTPTTGFGRVARGKITERHTRALSQTSDTPTTSYSVLANTGFNLHRPTFVENP